MKLFHEKDFAAAKDIFGKAGRGPLTEMAHSAAMYQRMCERRLSASLHSPENLHKEALALMSQGQLDLAEPLLRSAISLKPDAADYFYALAVCLAQSGQNDEAADSLRSALSRDPSARRRVLHEPHLAHLTEHPTVRDLLGLERS